MTKPLNGDGGQSMRVVLRGRLRISKAAAWQIEVNYRYDHMNNLLLVMLDRSMWFAPMFEAISADNWKPLTSNDPTLLGREAGLGEPLAFACGYSQVVFLCTAVEITLILHYVNSVAFFVNSGRGTLDGLPRLRKWVESQRGLASWDAWLGLPQHKRGRALFSLSFSSLPVAEEFFADIYGPSCFANAITRTRHRSLQKIFQQLQELRNGIVHRGGEHKDGRRIEIPVRVLRERHDLGKSIRDDILQFSRWCRLQWLERTP